MFKTPKSQKMICLILFFMILPFKSSRSQMKTPKYCLAVPKFYFIAFKNNILDIKFLLYGI